MPSYCKLFFIQPKKRKKKKKNSNGDKLKLILIEYLLLKLILCLQVYNLQVGNSKEKCACQQREKRVYLCDITKCFLFYSEK